MTKLNHPLISMFSCYHECIDKRLKQAPILSFRDIHAVIYDTFYNTNRVIRTDNLDCNANITTHLYIIIVTKLYMINTPLLIRSSLKLYIEAFLAT